jgi:hypothetical protein
MKKILPIALVLILTGCKTHGDTAQENKHLCDNHGGYQTWTYTKSRTFTLILCKDGSVKWADLL